MVDSRYLSRLEAYYRAFNGRQEEAYLACFHPEASLGGSFTGSEASGVGVQRAILRSSIGAMGDMTMVPDRFYQAQDEVAVAWVGAVTGLGGHRASVQGITLFAFDGEARIRRCRVFWDPRILSGPSHGEAVNPSHLAAIEAYYSAFNTRDWTGVSGLLSEGSLLGGTLVGPGFSGGPSLRSVFEATLARLPGIRMRPGQAYQAQDEVALHWEGRAQDRNGTLRPIEGLAIFRFDGAGGITRYRTYWNPLPLLQ